MEKIHADGSILTHRFTRAGFGNAPFRLIGHSENVFNNGDGTTKAGGTCDYCGTGIRWEFHVQSADGKKFKIGCDCARHLYDSKLVVVIESEMRKIKKAAAAAKKAAKEVADRAELPALAVIWEAALVKLADQPHPNEYFASQGKTLADYFLYFVPRDITKCYSATYAKKYVLAAAKRAE